MQSVRDKSSFPRLIYVMGIDGSGKTTAAEYIAQMLRDRGYDVSVRWLRFNHFLSKPLLGLCRLLGLTKYKMIEGIRVGHHEFYRSRLISWAFVLFQYLDAVRVKYLYILPTFIFPRRVLVLDRYVYDILIDIMIDTRLKDLDKGVVGRAFKKILPASTLPILLHRSREAVLHERPESRVDREFSDRFDMYDELASERGITVIDNKGTLEELLLSLDEKLPILHGSG